MRKQLSLFITGIVLVLIGAVLCIVSMVVLGFRFDSLDNQKLVTAEYNVTEEFRDIQIKLEGEKVVFETSKDDKCRVVFYDAEETERKVSVEDGVLNIMTEGTKKHGIEVMNVRIRPSKVTIYLPENVYGSLIIESAFGGVEIPEGYSFDTVKIDIAMGETELNGVVASKEISVMTNAGDIELDNCDAPEIYLKTNTGDISGTLLTGKIFKVHVTVGDIEVPGDGDGGICEITTNVGDVRMKIR